MLDEKALRRPTLDESTSAPVTLPGGVTWLLPRPHYRLRPTFRGGRLVREDARLCTDDPEFDRLVKAVGNAATDPAADFDAAMIDLTAYMLRVNYDLSDEQMGEVFDVLVDGDRRESWMKDVMAVAHGKVPKPSAVG